jgi:hypothetical protein
MMMLQRMCWNTGRWQFPTGSSSDGGYPQQNGFGHEEWNFRLDDSSHGHIFGYLYFTPSHDVQEAEGGRFSIGFWALHPDTRERLLVGFYHAASLPTDEDYVKLHADFTQKAVYERRIDELLQAVPRLGADRGKDEVVGAVTHRWLTFKCPVDEVEILPEPVPLPTSIGTKQIGLYFARPTYIDDAEAVKAVAAQGPAGSGAASMASGFRGRPVPLDEDAYYREIGPRLRLILRRHSVLSNSFAGWLRSNDLANVWQEKGRVDVEFQYEGGLCRAELKVCYGIGTTRSIREAMGQLLEYNLYGIREPADRWLIVLDEMPNSRDREFIQRLRTDLDLPVFLGWQDGGDGFTLEDWR